MPGLESRGAARVKLDASVTLKVDSSMKDQIRLLHEEQKANVSDISISGVGIMSPIFFPKGAILLIEMSAAALSIKKPINIKGEVRYCKPESAKKYRMGVKFIDIENEALNKIKDYVAKNESRQKPGAESK